jgi:transposase
VCSLGIIPNRLEAIRKVVAKTGPGKQLKACYEAGPTGYVLYWQLTQLGVNCEVIAASLVPAKSGRSCQDGPARCREAGAIVMAI